MNKILKNLFIINIVLFGMFFIGVGSADADSECIRCIYSYKEDVVNISETDATTSVAKHAKAQVVVQKKDDGKDASFSIKGICINNANNASAFTEALVGKCNFSNIDELNDSKTLKEHFYKNEKLSCPYMYIVSGGNSLTLHYIDKKPKDFTVDSKKTCDFNNNISAFTPDEKDPLTDGIPDTSSTGDTDYDHEAAKKIINWGKAAKDDKYLGEYSSGCDIIGHDVLVFLNNLFLIIQVIGIILLVFLSSVEFIKVITGSSEDGLSKALKNTLRRVIIVIILLILPLLITWVLEIVNDNNYLTDENGKVVIGDDGNPLCKGESSYKYNGIDNTGDRNTYNGSSSNDTYNNSNNKSVDSTPKETNLAKAKIRMAKSYYTTGLSKVEPELTVRLSGRTLVKGTNYTMKCSNNTKPGTATCKITGKGKYKGSKKVTFKLVNMGDDVARTACRLSYSRGKFYNNGKYPGTKAYYKAWKAAGSPNANRRAGRTCGAGVATIYRSSGYDKTMTSTANASLNYLANSSKWTKVGTYSKNKSLKENKLQPGDVLVRRGHIWMYVGSSIPKDIYKKEIKGKGVSGGDTGTPNGVWVSAHLSIHGGAAPGIGDSSWSLANNPYGHTVYIYRCTKPNNAKYRHGGAVQ